MVVLAVAVERWLPTVGDAAVGKKRQVVGLPIASHEAFEVVTVPGVLLALEEGANVGFRTWQCGGENRAEGDDPQGKEQLRRGHKWPPQ